MAGWIWLLALVAVTTLLQLLVYRRFRAGPDEESPSGEPPSDEAPRSGAGDGPLVGSTLDSAPDRSGLSSAADARHCPHCGAENDPDPEYTYCMSCVHRLR